MERNEMLKKLSEIKVIVTNMVVTYDMGIQFDVMTEKGVCTNIGNVGNWPCYKMPVTPELKELKRRVDNGEEITNEMVLDVEVCKKLLTYYYIFTGEEWVVGGKRLDECVRSLLENLKKLNVQQEVFYAYSDLEDWGDNIVLIFNEYSELSEYFRKGFGMDDDTYEGMDDDELEAAYENAEDEEWDGIPLKSYVDTENEEQ